MQQGGSDGGVGGEEAEHGCHVGRYHAAALGDAAQGFAPRPEGQGKLLFHGIGRHDRFSGFGAAGFGQCGGQSRHGCRDGGKREGGTDHAGGGGQDVHDVDPEGLRRQAAHLFRGLDPVGGAGVGDPAVAHDGAGGAVFQMPFRHGQGSTLDQVPGIHRRRCRWPVGENQGQVLFAPVFPDAAVDPRGGKTPGGGNAALNEG